MQSRFVVGLLQTDLAMQDSRQVGETQRKVRDGDKRIRTADPFNAIEVLYQLSYIPAQGNIVIIDVNLIMPFSCAAVNHDTRGRRVSRSSA